MKNYFDLFFEVLHKNSIKRRRMISLLLVLSMFVSSSVVWGLHGTVVTLVNEPIEEIDTGPPEDDELTAEQLRAHVHTDECYQDVLVCGFDEDDEHTHTEECYEKRLACCLDEPLDLEELSENAEIVYESYANADAEIDEKEEVEEERILVSVDELPELILRNNLQLLADDVTQKTEEQQNAPYMNPGTEETVDNIAEGIKFTLFDYGDSNLESQNNNYGFAGSYQNGDFVLSVPYKHNNVQTSGINTDRNIKDDIMFFAYGTPIPSGIQQSGDYVFYNYYDNNVHKYNPDKNSYSGDYNSNPHYSGNRPVSGIVNNTLTNSNNEFDKNGYPTVKDSGNSLAYLFDENNLYDSEGVAYKTVYQNVNHLLQKDGNFLYFNSNDNYAYYNKDTGNFTVYDTTFPIINENHHSAGDTDYYHLTKPEGAEEGIPTYYPNEQDPGFQIGFFPFDEYDPSRRDPNYNGNGYNHHFGMKMEATFTNPNNDNLPVNPKTGEKEPVSFKYSGDDDMWVFVDGVLVLDIGGIHEPTGGMIDFTNGLVWVQDNELGSTMSEVQSNLIDDTTNNINSAADFEKLPKPIGTDTSSSSSHGNKWVVTKISQYLTNWESTKYSEHEIKMFYLERGGCYSNLAMEMNLPTLKPLTVKKNVDYQAHLVNGLYEDYTYWFKVLEWDENADDGNGGHGAYVETQNTDPNGHLYIPEPTFGITAGDRKDFSNIGSTRKFKIVEIGYSTPTTPAGTYIPLDDTYSKVVINQDIDTGTDRLANGEAESEGNKLSDVNSYTFTNQIEQKYTKLNVTKNWIGATGSEYNSVKFRILRTDSVTGEVKQVAIAQPDGTKKRTFAINKQQDGTWPTYVFDNLLSQYGNHYYTYEVEELNAPVGFVASYEYGTDNSGSGSNGERNATIRNVNSNNTDIYVKKKWENVPTGDEPDVKLILKRESVGYSESQHTSLTINIYDEIGNLIKTETINNLYADGNAEIAYSLPKGVKLYYADHAYPQKQIGNGDVTPLAYSLNCTDTDSGHKHNNNCYIPHDNNDPNGELYVKFEEDEKILAVYDLNATNNVVSFKVTSEDAEDDLMLVHHSFSRGTSGWTTNTDSSTFVDNNEPKDKVITSGRISYAKNDALYVRGRTQSWHGAKLKLDPDKFKANKTYTFSVYVYNPGDDSDDFKLTFNNGLGGNQPITDPEYITIPGGSWKQLTGTITLDGNIDPYNMYLLIETRPYNQNGNDKPCKYSEFRVDEFVAVEGRREISVSQQTGNGDTFETQGGIVTISGEVTSSTTSALNQEVYYYGFTNVNSNTGLGHGWTAKDESTASDATQQNLATGPPVGEDAQNNFHFVRVWNRDATGDGIQRQDVSFLQKNHTYTFQVTAQHAGPSGADKVHLTLYVNGSGVNWGNNPNNHYPWVCEVDISESDYKVNQNTGDKFTIPNDADISGMYMYFETFSDYNNKYGAFRIWEVRITDVTETTTYTAENIADTEANRIPGYKIENGKYVTDYSNYKLELDENSVTNPTKLNGEYAPGRVDDNDPNSEIWSKEIILTGDEATAWMKHYTKNDLGEQNTRLYRYYIAEEQIKIGDTWITVPLGKDATEVQSTDTDHSYLVSVDGDNVATNTENSPITVTNKYIWYKLPDTGGIGTDRVYLLSLLLITTGILSGCCVCSRKRRRE